MNEHNNYQISVVIPVCNEADNIYPMYEEVAAIGLNSWEIIYVDDGSTDTTWETLQRLQAEHPQVQIFKHARNFGQSVALITGIEHARYPYIVTLDGDGQNDPADIPTLVVEHQKVSQADPAVHHVILGNRKRRQDHLIRLISTKIARLIRKVVFNDDCPDSGCAIKLFLREDFMRLPKFKNMHRFLPVLFRRDGVKTHNRVVNHRQRTRGVTKYGVLNRAFAGLFDLIGVYWLLSRPNRSELEK